MDLRVAEKLALDLMGQFGLLGADMVLYQPNANVDALRARYSATGKMLALDARWRFEFDTARVTFGRCNYSRRKITLSRALVSINDEANVRDTILHEIAHALCPFNAGHSSIWKQMARYVGAKPEACYSAKDVATITYKWRWICQDCGDEKTTIQRRPPGYRMCMDCFNRDKAIDAQRASLNYRRYTYQWDKMEQVVRQPTGAACAPARQIATFTMTLPPLPVLATIPAATPIVPVQAVPLVSPSGAWSPAEAVALYNAGRKVADIAVYFGYPRGQGQNRVRTALIKAGVYTR